MNDKLSQALDHISDRHLSEAAAPVRHRYYPYLGAIAAVLALVLTASFLFAPLGQFFVPTPTTTAPILQEPTHSCHPTTTPTHPSTIPSTQPSTMPSTQHSTIPSIPSSSVPTSSTLSTQPSSTQTPTTVTRPTVGDPCANGHFYSKNGFCNICRSANPDYDPCADGHNFQDYYCTDCGFRHHCADGHSYEDGICTWCWAPDPAVAVRSTVTLDKAMYTTNESVCFTISPSGTTYELNIIRYAFSFADEPWERHYKDVGTSYTLSFDQPGRYEVSVVPNSNLDTIWQSSTTSFAIVDPCTSSSGHTFDRGFCTICRAKDYLYDFCGAVGCTSYIHGYCRHCGSVFPACATGHTYSKQTGRCAHCGATHPACYNGHTYKDGFCINCGVFDPNTDPCANGHTFDDGCCVYCEKPDPSISAPTFATIVSDAPNYELGDTVNFYMYCDGTTNALRIYKPDGYAESFQNVGNNYSYTPTMIGQYQVAVFTRNGDFTLQSEKITFYVNAPNA